MAESVVSLAVERISDLLIREAVFLHGVKDEVQRLQAELKRMQCFLKDADRKQEQDKRVRNWVNEIRGVAYDVEDVIETFILKVATRGGGLYGSLKKLASIFSRGYHLHKIGTKIKSIRTNLADISNSLQAYGIKFGEEGEGTTSRREMQQRLRRSYPHAEEDDVFGLEACMTDVIAQLTKEENRLRVVSIVGMGGSGKTTLAKKVYNRTDVRRHFECCAWAFISQQFATKDVLSGILEKVNNRFVPEEMKEEKLVESLYKFLNERRYLVVLDDIWKIEAWDSLKHAFPNGKRGSKILFTTRNKEVASYADPWSSPIDPPLLNDEQSWELLCRKAFPREIFGDHGRCPPEFENSGREMARKCGGLPLALVVLGGLLATKSSDEWATVQRDINAHLISKTQQQGEEEEYGGVYGVLSLSYHELPYYLKPCFLHLGHFPEDWEIQKKKLIRLWIAEGFVPLELQGDHHQGQLEMVAEDVGEGYFEELINRCMVLVGRRELATRGVKTCRLHDLMREVCVSKAREENFLGIVQLQDNMTTAVNEDDIDPSSYTLLATTDARRIAIHHPYFLRFVSLLQGYPQLRSLLCFSKISRERFALGRKDQIFICKNFRLLRVLDLEGFRFESYRFPREIGNLIHLRYLSLRNCYYFRQRLPQSICNLRSLFTLDLRGFHSTRLAGMIWKMEHLRHLLLSYPYQCEHVRLDTLTNLETAKNVKAESIIRNGVLKLTNLRNLGIHFDKSEQVEVVLKSAIVQSARLRSLKAFGISYPSLQPLSHCHRLVKLELDGRIREDVQHLEFLPPNLNKLLLRRTRLMQDPMPILEKLRNLRILKLRWDSYLGHEMVCSAHGFPQLEFLELEGLEQLQEWIVWEGAMPSLKSLQIDRLFGLRMIPEGLKSVTTLRELTIRDVKEAFADRLRVVKGIEGKDLHIVRHIPSVNIGQTFY